MSERSMDLMEYLKMATELEASVYRQEEAIKRLDCFIQQNDPRKKYNLAVSKANEERSNLPKEESYTRNLVYEREQHSYEYESGLEISGGDVFLFIVGGVLCWIGISMNMTALLLIGSVLIVIPVIRMIKTSNKGKSKEEEYQNKLNEKKEAFKRNYDAKLLKIENDIEKAKQSLPADIKRDSIAKGERYKLFESLSETRNVLSRLYESNIIYPKYRNMVAMCSIYEYFATGRCTELTGPNGAYNLYESELRQNTIINKLDTIINQLEAIKNNQYMLYTEMVKTNGMLLGIV